MFLVNSVALLRRYMTKTIMLARTLLFICTTEINWMPPVWSPLWSSGNRLILQDSCILSLPWPQSLSGTTSKHVPTQSTVCYEEECASSGADGWLQISAILWHKKCDKIYTWGEWEMSLPSSDLKSVLCKQGLCSKLPALGNFQVFMSYQFVTQSQKSRQ